jgi:alkyl hydroperoxide reductase subunit D
MSLQTLKDAMPEYAKDTKLNLSSVLSETGAPGLSINQVMGIALACAYATQNRYVIVQMEAECNALISPEEIQAAKAASVIMAMNNVYYRFTHSTADTQYQQLPARLRMNVIGNPGIEKVDFELYALAVSAINNCSFCVDSHIEAVYKHDITKEGVQSAVRIAAVVQAAAQAAVIEGL